ncbi:MAG: hypothetical protein AAB293_00860 [Pseudomonadota bacterium]
MLKKIKHVIAAGFIASILSTPNVTYADATPAVLGKTIGEWSAKWWQWALAASASSNPMIDNTGANCNVSQKGPVWFLAGVWGGGTVERNCTVPNGKYIFNAFWLNSIDTPDLKEANWRQLANDFLPPSIGGDLEATLNGTPIIFNPQTPIIRSQSPVFTAKFPDENIFELPTDILTGFPIVSDGFWVMLPPLDPGLHVLNFRAGTSQNITYHLTVAD